MKRLLLIPILVFVCFYSQAQRQGVKIDSCSFKDSCSLVRNLSDTGLWQIGTPSKVFFALGGNGSSGPLTDSASTYPPNIHEYVDVHFENIYNIRFAFWHRYDTDTLADGGYIEASYDEGITWQDIHQYDSNNQPIYMNVYGMYPESVALGNGKSGFSGRSKDTVLTILEWVWEGKQILKQTLNGQRQSSLDLSEYPSGMCFYTLMENGSVVATGKLVKE